jgi:polar amino acid transport system ATP-binding protein
MSLVKIENIRKNFGALEVLKDISMDVHKGEIVSIIGRSGAGKSTFLRCINGLESIQSGKIVVDGVDVGAPGTDLRKLRRKVGFVFQSFNLFPHLNVLDNITLALRIVNRMGYSQSSEIAANVLQKVGMEERRAAFPDQLSGGQQQRVAIARSLAMNPQLMLFDEITSALDPELIGEVLNVLDNLAQGGMTMILVTHEIGFARKVSDHLVFMHQGVIWESGPPEQLFNTPKTEELATFLQSVI